MKSKLNALKEKFENFKSEILEEFMKKSSQKDPVNNLLLGKILGDNALKAYDGTNAKETHNVKTIDYIISSLFYDFAESSYIEVEDYDISNVVSVIAIKNGEVDKKYLWIINFKGDGSLSEKQTTIDNQKDLFKKIEDNIKIFLGVYYDNLEASINSWFGLDTNKAKSTLIIDVTFNGDAIKGKQQPVITKETKPNTSLLSNFLSEGISEEEDENSED